MDTTNISINCKFLPSTESRIKALTWQACVMRTIRCFFPIICKFENNTGLSMCDVMLNRKTLSYKQMWLFPVCKNLLIVPFQSFILFLLVTAPIASWVSLFSLETKPLLIEGNCEIHKLLRKICLMIFQTWFNELFMFCFLQVALWWKSSKVKDQLYSPKRMARLVSLISEVLRWPHPTLPWDS